MVTADGVPLMAAITGTNGHDSMLVEPILDGLTPVKGNPLAPAEMARILCWDHVSGVLHFS